VTTVTDRGQAERAEGAGKPPLRFVTAASLFDGHDAAINVMRRLIQDSGAEVVHLGHNRSVRDVVRAAIQEDADGVAISSYQGGHTEYFRYAVEMLRDAGADHIRVFGGGGGTITPGEIADLEAFGVERIYHPNDGMSLGLVGMIDDLVERAATKRVVPPAPDESRTDDLGVARMLSALEDSAFTDDELERLRTQWTVKGTGVPVVGVTGTGGAGKSTVTDELLSRFAAHLPDLRIAVLAVDPTRRRTGGALLGDRIRMNSLRHEQLYMRSMATRRQNLSTNAVLADAVAYLRAAEFDLVIVETAGIGQSDSEIVDLVDLPVYVMTSEFGAASQLEKIDMLDLAEIVVINKFDKQ
jgi:methylmalonyl-CoA mutase